jgi:uncharacterized Zn-binding protein involved in type VI secretion
MPAVARMSGVDKVFSPHGTGKKCKFPTTQSTQSGSSRVFISGTGVVRAGVTEDPTIMSEHNMSGCILHSPTFDSGSSRVFVEGKPIGRIGDTYGGEHPIISGSSRVFSS